MTQTTAYPTLLQAITKAAQKTPQLKPRPVHTPPNGRGSNWMKTAGMHPSGVIQAWA